MTEEEIDLIATQVEKRIRERIEQQMIVSYLTRIETKVDAIRSILASAMRLDEKPLGADESPPGTEPA